jgi:CDP-6-deoxy-D-xylo-4-hexulose-3-dehydrase
MMDYKLASSTWGDEELDAIKRVIDSDKYSMDKEVHDYERQFADYFKSKHCVMVNSGSSANLLMIAAMFFTKDRTKRLSRGDEVIVPAVSWSTTYFPLQQYGLKLVFVDIDSDTLNFNLEALKLAITDKTKAILAVNLLGNPNDFDEVNALVEK